MQPEAFAAYNSVYETVSGTCGRWVIATFLGVLTIVPFAAFAGKHPGRTRAQALLLSLGLSLLVLGSYYFSGSDGLRLLTLYSGGAFLCVYGLAWGFSELPSASIFSMLCIFLTLLRTVLKLVSIPPSQRSVTKGMFTRFALS